MNVDMLETTPTRDISVGDLCRFWEMHGIYLGHASVSDVVVRKAFEPAGSNRIDVFFSFINPMSGAVEMRTSYLKFSSEPPELVPEDFEFVILFIDNDIAVLPRAHVRSFFYDDGLCVVNRVNVS